MWTRIHKALRVVTPTHVEEDQTGTGRPVKVEEHDIDFRVPGLSHVRVQELVKRIENHPHQEALHADLQQKKRVQPMQQKVEGDDPRVGQCGVIRVVRNYTKSTMFSLSSSVESRNCVLHLWTLLD